MTYWPPSTDPLVVAINEIIAEAERAKRDLRLEGSFDIERIAHAFESLRSRLPGHRPNASADKQTA